MDSHELHADDLSHLLHFTSNNMTLGRATVTLHHCELLSAWELNEVEEKLQILAAPAVAVVTTLMAIIPPSITNEFGQLHTPHQLNPRST